MAITLTEQLLAFDTPALRQKAQAALYTSAQAALVEVATTPNHVNRVILAKQIIFATGGQFTDAGLRVAISANAAGAANLAAVQNATDAQVQAAITAAYDAMANGG